MTAQPSADSVVRYRTLLFLVLIAAGLAGNYFNVFILNAYFVFGSIFAMLVLQFFGPAHGIVAAAVIASYTYFAWNHPYTVMTMTAEVAVVGWLTSRRKTNLVMADALYWLFVGIPLGYLGFHIISHFGVSNTLFLMTKQSINGIANALIARLIFTGYLFRSHAASISLREVLSNILVFFVLCPALILMSIGSKADFAETDRQIRSMLSHDSRQATDSLENWVGERRRPIVTLAKMAEMLPPAQMQGHLEQVRAADVNFLRIALIDGEGIAVAYSPRVDEQGRNTIGKSFADRPAIPLLKQKREPMLSEVMASRFGRPDPIAIMLAPVISRGEYRGYVAGVLNFERLRAILELIAAGRSVRYTLLDRSGKIIITNRADQRAMAPFSRGKGTLSPPERGLSRWIPVLPPNTSTIDLWGKSLYVSESTVGNFAEWRLILEQPVAPYQKQLYDNYTGKFFLLFMIVLGSLALAELVSRRITKTIEQLSFITHDLPVKLTAETQISWPSKSIIQETDRLLRHFREMADSLREKFLENRKMNESLEQRVAERTEALREKTEEIDYERERLAVTLGSIGDGVITTDIQGRVTFLNRVAEELTGWPHAEAVGQPLSAVFRIVDENTRRDRENPVELVLQRGGIVGLANHTALIRRDGKELVIADSGAPIRDRDSVIVGVVLVFRDNTEKEKADRALQSADKLQAVGMLAAGIAHDFNNLLSGLFGYIDLAGEHAARNDSEGATANLAKAREVFGRAKHLTQELLTFSKGSRPIRKTMSIVELVEKAVYFALSGSNVTPLFSIEGAIWLCDIDEHQLAQVFDNIVLNARQSMPQGGKVEITIGNVVAAAAPKSLPPNDYVRISVRDYGTGIMKEHLLQMFVPFFTTKQAGSGLGLATSYAIVKKHDGTIEVESELGKGSTFHVYLPASPSREATAQPVLDHGHAGHGRVLVMDDEESILDVLCQRLGEMGYDAVMADNGDKALELVREAAEKGAPFSIAILDLTIPGGRGGKDIAREILAIAPAIKLVASSGYSEDPVMTAPADYGFRQRLVKPYRKDDIARVMESLAG